MQPHERIIFPLDMSSIHSAIQMVRTLYKHVGVFKIGFEAIYSSMAELLLHPEQDAINNLKAIIALRRMLSPEKVFLDVKLADIPNTVGAAMKALARLEAKIVNIHASAGEEVIKAAAANKGKSLLFGVTVLTSINSKNPKECVSIFGSDPITKVLDFAHMLADNGADGVICAPAEGLQIRRFFCFNKLIVACPNVRPEWAAGPDDQAKSRQMTPGEAIRAGIDMLVIGRPIAKPPAGIGGPAAAAQMIAEEIKDACAVPVQNE